jgi:hypothetical protein
MVFTVSHDPYTIRVGLKTGNELSQLRRRYKTGKRLERFHRKQNDVGASLVPYYFDDRSAHLLDAEAYGTAHGEEAKKDERDYHFAVRATLLETHFC